MGFFDSQLTPRQKWDVRQGLRSGIRNLAQISSPEFFPLAGEGISAFPSIESRLETALDTPRFDTQILFGTSRPAGSAPAPSKRGAPPAPILPSAGSRTPITSPNTTFQNADEEYKTLLSQYGGTSGVQQLAGMQSLPTGFTPTGGKQAAGLEDYYSAQRAVGAKNIGEITGALGYQKGSPMEQWAKANPMLAMREFNKKFPAGAPTQGPSDEAIRAAMGGGTYFPSEGSPSPVANAPTLAGQTSFSNVANAVPAPPQRQGAAVSAPYAEANAQAAEKTAGETGMPNLPTTAKPQTTLDKVSGFLNGLTPVIKAVFPAGAGQIFGPRY